MRCRTRSLICRAGVVWRRIPSVLLEALWRSMRHLVPDSSAAWRIAVVGLALFTGPVSRGSLSKPTLLSLTFEQKLDATVPLTLVFTNEQGKAVHLGECFRGRPVILVPGYYGCPMLCGLVLNGLVESLQDIRPTPGKDFELLFVSIDPRESPSIAAAKKRTYLKRYGRTNTEGGWHFLVGREAEIRELCDAIGFQYAYDSELKQYAHPGGIVILTPEGRVTRYFFGVEFPAAKLQAAFQDAGARRVGSPVQQLLMLCFSRMPLVGENSARIMTAVRSLAVITILSVAGYIILSVRKEGRPARRHGSGA